MLFPIPSLSTNKQSAHRVDKLVIIGRSAKDTPLLLVGQESQIAPLLVVRHGVAQTGNTQEWQTSAGTVYGSMLVNGNRGEFRVLGNGAFIRMDGDCRIQSDNAANNMLLFGTNTGGLALYGVCNTIRARNSILIMQDNAQPSGSITLLTVNGAANTGVTASTETPDINFNLARTVQFATGAITMQRAMRIQPPTYSFVGASTITNAVTLDIGGAPVAGTNATITTSLGLRVAGGALIGTSTNDMIGHWGSTPVVQQVLATGASKTVDDVISLLQTLGLCKQS